MKKEKKDKFPIKEEERNGIGGRVRELIGDSLLKKFANNCGISEGAIRSIVKDSTSPRLDNLISMANVGGVTVEWLATGRGSKTYDEPGQAQAQKQVQAPLEPLSEEQKINVGKALKGSRKILQEAIEEVDFEPNIDVKQYMQTSIFHSLIKEPIDKETLVPFLEMMKGMKK